MHKAINEDLIKTVRQEAAVSPRKRKNYNFHKKAEDLLQRMLNAMNPGTYVQPHKHESPDKREVFLILTGRIAVLEFNDEGEIIHTIILDRSLGSYGVEIPSRSWHTVISLEPGSVVYEVKDGPYLPIDDKNFAPWAPKEGDLSCAEYLRQLSNKAGLE